MRRFRNTSVHGRGTGRLFDPLPTNRMNEMRSRSSCASHRSCESTGTIRREPSPQSLRAPCQNPALRVEDDLPSPSLATEECGTPTDESDRVLINSMGWYPPQGLGCRDP